MTYQEYTQNRQKEANALPIFYAFSEDRLAEKLAEKGYTLEDAPKVLYRLSGAGFYFKSDAKIIEDYFKVDRDKELRELMEKDLKFAYEAFEYEMFNHEYPINWQGDWDVCGCFGDVEYDESKSGFDYLRELGFSDPVLKEYEKARRHVQKSIEW